MNLEKQTEAVASVVDQGPMLGALDHLADVMIDRLVLKLRQRPDAVSSVLGVFETRWKELQPEAAFMKVADYADRVGVCKRTVENWISDGLPIVGAGRLRRVPVDEADTWFRNLGKDEDIVERARQKARRVGGQP